MSANFENQAGSQFSTISLGGNYVGGGKQRQTDYLKWSAEYQTMNTLKSKPKKLGRPIQSLQVAEVRGAK